MLIPEREGAGNDLNAVTLRPAIVTARVSRDDVDVVRFYMACTQRIGRQQLDDADNLQII